MVDILYTLSISTRGFEEGFAIPLRLTQPRLCCPMGLRHWGSLCGFAHVNSTHQSGLLSLPILVFSCRDRLNMMIRSCDDQEARLVSASLAMLVESALVVGGCY